MSLYVPPNSQIPISLVKAHSIFPTSKNPRTSSALRWYSSPMDDDIEVEDETIEVDNLTNDQVPQEKEKKNK